MIQMFKRLLIGFLITALLATTMVTVAADGPSHAVDYDTFDGLEKKSYIWDYNPDIAGGESVLLCNTRDQLMEALKHLYLPTSYADAYADDYFETKSLLLFKGHGHDLGVQWSVTNLTVDGQTLNLSLLSNRPADIAAGQAVFYRIYRVTINEKITNIDTIHLTTTYQLYNNEPVVTQEDFAYPAQLFLDFGDVDGNLDITAEDALLVLQSVVGKTKLSGVQTHAAKVTENQTLGAADALMILQYVVGKINFFPAARLKISVDSKRGELGVVASEQEQWTDDIAILSNQEDLNDYMAQHGLTQVTEDVEQANRAFDHGNHLLVYSFAVMQGETDRMKHQCTVYYLPGAEINLQLDLVNTNYHYVKADQADELTATVHYMYVWIDSNRMDHQNLFVNATQTNIVIDGPSGKKLEETTQENKYTFN